MPLRSVSCQTLIRAGFWPQGLAASAEAYYTGRVCRLTMTPQAPPFRHTVYRDGKPDMTLTLVHSIDRQSLEEQKRSEGDLWARLRAFEERHGIPKNWIDHTKNTEEFLEKLDQYVEQMEEEDR